MSPRFFPPGTVGEGHRSNVQTNAVLYTIVPVVLCFFFLLGLSSSGTGCRQPESQNAVLPPDTFARLYADIIVQSIGESAADSLVTERDRGIVMSVLQKNNIGEEDFDRSLAHYRQNYEAWLPIYEKVIELVEEKNSGIK